MAILCSNRAVQCMIFCGTKTDPREISRAGTGTSSSGVSPSATVSSRSNAFFANVLKSCAIEVSGGMAKRLNSGCSQTMRGQLFRQEKPNRRRVNRPPPRFLPRRRSWRSLQRRAVYGACRPDRRPGPAAAEKCVVDDHPLQREPVCAHDLFKSFSAVARGVSRGAGEQQADAAVAEAGEVIDRFGHRLKFIGEDGIYSIQMVRHVIDADQGSRCDRPHSKARRFRKSKEIAPQRVRSSTMAR